MDQTSTSTVVDVAERQTRGFLLVTPVATTGGSAAVAAPDDGAARFVSRSSARPQTLSYRLETRDPLPAAPVETGALSVRAIHTWVADLGETTVVVVECEAQAQAEEVFSAARLEELEATLTELGAQVATDVLGCSRDAVTWVGRYALGDPTEGWHAAETVEQQLNGSPATTFVGGWGNGAVRGWGQLDDTCREEVISGLVDAQYLWQQVDSLARNSLQAVAGLRTPDARVRAAELRGMQRSVEAQWMALARHHTAADDLYLNVQGVRRTVALTSLEAWRYEEVMGRVSRRISDADNVVSRKRERFERRYQSTVEVVLFVLGLLTFVEIVLAAISTAYSGAVDTVPGAAGVGLFAWLRDTSSDTLVLGAVGLVVAAALLVTVRRRT